MRLPWSVYLGMRQLIPTGRRFGSVFFLLSVIGVGLGVAVLVVVQSVMGGFGEIHRERIIDTSGHLDINEGGYPFQGGFDLAQSLRDADGVEAVMPYARGFAMVRHEAVPVFPAIFGLVPTTKPVFAVERYLSAGSMDDLYDDTAFVSQSLANRLRVYIGDEVEVFSPSMLDDLQSQEFILPRKFTVAGIYNIDWNQEYLPGMVVTLRSMQDLYGLDDRIHGISVRLSPGADDVTMAGEMREVFGDSKQVFTWKEQWKDFLWVLDLEKTMMLFLNLFIVAVAVFAIAIAQLLTVYRKTREIGLLAVMGAKQRAILGLYCFQGFFIGLLGSIGGVIIAITALSFRDPIISALATLTGSRDTLVKFYYFAYLPVSYDVIEIVLISVLATALATGASLLPAWRASRLRPAETLRIEQ